MAGVAEGHDVVQGVGAAQLELDDMVADIGPFPAHGTGSSEDVLELREASDRLVEPLTFLGDGPWIVDRAFISFGPFAEESDAGGGIDGTSELVPELAEHLVKVSVVRHLLRPGRRHSDDSPVTERLPADLEPGPVFIHTVGDQFEVLLDPFDGGFGLGFDLGSSALRIEA